MDTNLDETAKEWSQPMSSAEVAPTTSNVIPLHTAASASVKASPRHDLPDQPPGMPAGYFVQGACLCTMRAAKEGDEEVVQLCPAFVVEARYRTMDGQRWGRVICFTDPDGRQHRLQVLDRDLASHPQLVLATMADKGLELPFEKSERDLLLKLIRSSRPHRTMSSVSTFGWTNDEVRSFVLRPDKVVGGDDVIAGFDTDPDLVACVREAGTVQDWRARVGAKCVGNPLLTFAVSVGFVGPLLRLLGLPGCGFHLHGGPGKGKSTLLAAAASVMGDRSFRGSWNITKNAVEGYAAARNDNVLILDEIGEAMASTLSETIYMVGNGQGKGRASYRGEATPRATFRLAILSSGELAARDHGTSTGKHMPDDTSIRLIDLRADRRLHGAFDTLHGATSAADFARQIDRATREVFGTAGRHFIEGLIRNRDKKDQWLKVHRKYAQEMRRSLFGAPDGQVERAIERFAAVALAGELATKVGLTGWKPGEAKAAAASLLHDWFTNRTVVDGLLGTDVLATTQDWLRVNSSDILSQSDYLRGPVTGPFKAAKDNTWIYVAADLWAEIHGPEDATAAARAMVKLEVMDHGDGNNMKPKTPRWIPGRPRAYRLRLASFEDVLQSNSE